MIQFNGGKADSWLRAGEDDLLPIGYYQQSYLAFLGQAAPAWTMCDGYFSAVMAEIYPNRFYMHAAQTDRTHNSTVTSTLPTIRDRLATAGRTGRYYVSDLPFVALWGTTYLPISKPFATFLSDAARPGPCPTSRSSTRGSWTRALAPRVMTTRTRTSGLGSSSSTRSTRR